MIHIGFTLYSDEDYYKGYQSILKEKGKFFLGDMKELLKRIMGFSPLKEELNKIRNLLNEKAKKANNYTSYDHYCFDYYHHRTAASDPNTVFRSPPTKGMNYGFYDFDNIDNRQVNNVYKPLIKCPETKFAECLIKLKHTPLKK